VIQNLKIVFCVLLSVAAIYSCNDKVDSSNLKNGNPSNEIVKDTLVFGSPIVFGKIQVGLKDEVEIEIDKFKTFEQLSNRIEQIVCNDSLPFFKIESDSTYKIIYTINPCWDLYACILIYQRNVMIVSNDSVITYFDSIQPMDNLATLLKTQIQNFGQSEFHAESFKKLIFTIEENSLIGQSLRDRLDKLTTVYFNVTNRTDLHLRIDMPIEPPDFLLDSLNKKNTP
jgi:hypothetical protein